MLVAGMDYLVFQRRILSCLSVTYGTAAEEHHLAMGAADRQGNPIGEDSLFDLASLTKLFTGLLVMRLREEGLLDLSRPVTDYAPQFSALYAVPVEQVLGFQVALVTPERVDTQPDAALGLRQLFAAQARPVTGRHYSDMPAMVLKYVIEGAAGQPYEDVLASRILAPLGMASTFARVPQARLGDCICYDGEHRIEGERWFIRQGITPGTPHDPKARLLFQGGECCGHAGLFSTRADMTRLCQALLAGKVVSRESLTLMAKNRTGRPLPDGKWTQFLGYQCYVKHPDQYYSEIPAFMSSQAIGMGGFTGHHLSIDPVTGTFVLFLGNRVMDRLTVLVPEEGRCLTDYGLAPDGSGQLLWKDGTLVNSSVNYVHQKDARLHTPIGQLLRLPPWQPVGNEWPACP